MSTSPYNHCVTGMLPVQKEDLTSRDTPLLPITAQMQQKLGQV